MGGEVEVVKAVAEEAMPTSSLDPCLLAPHAWPILTLSCGGHHNLFALHCIA